MLTHDEILTQSKNAFGQWKDRWEANAKANGEKYKKDGNCHRDLAGEGAGKNLLTIGLGASFENEIGKLKKYLPHKNVDVMCIDKCFGILLDNGIKPKYVVIADAGISYEKYCEKWIDKTEDLVLFANITSQIEWAANWKGKVVYYVNKDNINTQDIYKKISGCHDIIPAASNVGNTCVVIASQVLGYREVWLLGYDFSWATSDNYYSFDGATEKRYWMHHINMIDKIGRLVHTSSNLYFSCRWLYDYVAKIHGETIMRIYDVSGQGVLYIQQAILERKLQTAKKHKVSKEEINAIVNARKRIETIAAAEGDKKLQKVIADTNVLNVMVEHLRTNDIEYIESLRCA